MWYATFLEFNPVPFFEQETFIGLTVKVALH